MKRDPRRHVLIDANVLLAYVAPETHKSRAVQDRAKNLIESVVKYGWPTLSLYTPSVCLAEAQCALDKRRYCDWYGDGKNGVLSAEVYKRGVKGLRDLVVEGRITKIEVEAVDLDAARLVSVVNSKYQIRKRRKSKKDITTSAQKVGRQKVRGPMGAVDCLIVGMAIRLGARIGTDVVTIATADSRLADVVRRCRKLSHKRAKALQLPKVSQNIPIVWSKEIYPCCIHLEHAREDEIRSSFGGWPLPGRSLTHKEYGDLTIKQSECLYKLGVDIKGEYGVGPDSLPYTDALDELQSRFAIRTGVYLPKSAIAKLLLQWRKNPQSRPRTQLFLDGFE